MSKNNFDKVCEKNVYFDCLADLQVASVIHSDSLLLHHLIGTSCILGKWGASFELCKAALFHSIYGTHSFKHNFKATIENRVKIRKLIGCEAESIVYYYSVSKLSSILDDLKSKKRVSRISSNTIKLVNFLNLTVANEIEQLYRSGYPISPEIVLAFDEIEPFLFDGAVTTLSKAMN